MNSHFSKYKDLLFALILLVILGGGSSFAAEKASEVVDLQPIMVSLVRASISSGRVAENAVVYSAKDLNAMTVRDVADALVYIPGVDVSVGSRLSQPTSLSIHGSNSRDVLVMVDDIPFNTQLSGQVNPTRLPLENIRRIELIKGAASSAWGSALGGVMNVITKDVGNTIAPKARISSSFAGYDTQKQDFDIAGMLGTAGYFFSGSRLTSDGARSQAFTTVENGFGKMSLPLADDAKVTASFGLNAGRIQNGVMPNNRINKTPFISRYGKLVLGVEKPESSAEIAYKYNDQDTTTDAYNASTGAQVSATVNHDLYHGMSISANRVMREADLLVIGSDLDWHVIKSNNYLKTSKSIATQAPYINYTVRAGQWDIVPGARFDNNNRFGNQLSPSLGCVYHFDEADAQWRIKVARAFNAPPLMWIYNDDPSIPVFANPDLKAERANVYETGVSTRLASVGLRLDLFHQNVSDGIMTSGGQKQNIGRLRRQGGEAQVDYRVSSMLKAYASGGFNNVENRVTHKLVRGNGATRQSFRAGISYSFFRNMEADLSARYARWDSNAAQANDRKPIFDMKLTRKWESPRYHYEVEAFMSVYNISNSKYWSDPSYPLALRYYETGITVSF